MYHVTSFCCCQTTARISFTLISYCCWFPFKILELTGISNAFKTSLFDDLSTELDDLEVTTRCSLCNSTHKFSYFPHESLHGLKQSRCWNHVRLVCVNSKQVQLSLSFQTYLSEISSPLLFEQLKCTASETRGSLSPSRNTNHSFIVFIDPEIKGNWILGNCSKHQFLHCKIHH